MVATLLKAGSLTVLVVLAAVLLQRRSEQQLQERLQTVLSNLLRAEHKGQSSSAEPRRVAVGLGSCLDSTLTALKLFDRISLDPPDLTAARHHGSIGSEQQLAEAFAYFFKHGAAAERYVSDKTLFKRLVAAARDLEGTQWTIGGNAPVMANRMAREGCSILLGSVISDTIAKEIEPNVRVTQHSPDTEDEEIHIILEYKTGETWGSFTAPRSNRFIVHSDSSNPLLSSLESFRQQQKQFKPHAVVIGGLQMMDNFPFEGEAREKRLSELRQMLTEEVPPEVPVHFEFASFAEEATALAVVEQVARHADSLGMNEQELPNLASLLAHGNVSLVADAYPRVATVLDQMRSVYRSLGQRSPAAAGRGAPRRLTRLHVHTLAFQAVLTARGSAWRDTMAAAAKASLTAHRHVCASPEVQVARAHLIMDDSFALSREADIGRVSFQNHRPVSCWEEEGEGEGSGYQICLAPVLVCTQVSKTAGGGDNISSAALSVQI